MARRRHQREERQRDLFDGEAPLGDLRGASGTPDPTAEPWSDELTQRLRVMLHTSPLHQLRRGDALRAPELRHYDSLALALKALEVIADRAGLEREADAKMVASALDPLLEAMDRAAGLAPDPERHAAMVDRVIAGLRNDRHARRPFRYPYVALDADACAREHFVEFRLLAEAFHPRGGTVLRLSNEAVNLYLRLLELDIEDAQAAAEAIVSSQLDRGRFGEAVESARHARLQSGRFRQKVARIIRLTRQDVARVDWRDAVPRLLDEAIDHVTGRLETEQAILRAADTKLDLLATASSRARRALVQVTDLVRDCRVRHAELHEALMKARNVFLDAQAAQVFVPRPAATLPGLADGALQPLLALGRAAARAVTADAGRFAGAAPPPVLDLEALTAWQLRPRRPTPRTHVPVRPVDPGHLEAEILRYPAAARDAARQRWRAIDRPLTLSALLAEARAAGAERAVLELLVLFALAAFASEARPAADARLRVRRAPGTLLDDADFYGDELLLTPSTDPGPEEGGADAARR